MNLLAHLEAQLAEIKDASRWLVALSGGRDSVTLLHLVANVAHRGSTPPVIAVHIHHGVAAEADVWVASCAAMCESIDIDLEVIRCGPFDPGQSDLENRLRMARYAQFKRILRSNDCLLMAHHQDDQAETVLLRLLRGAGPTGLGAIPHRRRLGEGTLFRPLLDVPRSLLTEWATARDLQWFDDPANKDSRFDRNFLRQDVLPLLAKRWPGYRGTLARVARHQSNLARDLSANIADDLSPLGEPVWEIDPGVVDDDIVRALHCWLIQQPVNAPDLVRLEEFARQILTSRFDRIPELAWGEMCLRKWRSHVYLGPRKISLFQDRLRLAVGQSVEGDWGRLDWQSSERGLSEGHIVECRRRLPGERLAPLGRPMRPLSRWFQECGVPPWWRDSAPVVCVSDVTVAVSNCGLTKAAEVAGESAEAGLVPIWRPLQMKGEQMKGEMVEDFN